jgi:CheY-like chemotaxis protein
MLAMQEAATHVSALRTRPLNVIVADDVVEIQVLVETWLNDIGCLVKCASSGHEVSKLLGQQHFDLVITDVLMPDGDGLDVIVELKQSQRKTRVLAISGGGRHLQAAQCLKMAHGLGAHEVLLKPFNRQQLLAAVRRVTQAGN